LDQLSHQPVTQLLMQWRGGNEAALGELTSLLYHELRALAQRHLRRERPDHTIQRTALVHEAFVRLVDQSVDWRSRSHFFALASTVMRRILVDHARARLASKRGAGAVVLSLDEVVERSDADDQGESAPLVPEPAQPESESDEDLAAIDAALTRLATLDARQAKIVELRYFGGLTIEETAQALEISDATVKREWTLARAWLKREVTQGR
jgi:RNA polymerase sigma factor (sigma-70 family)